MNLLQLEIYITNKNTLLINCLLLFLFLYCTRLKTSLHLIEAVIVFSVTFSIIINNQFKKNPVLWLLILILLSLELINNFYYSANHHFVLIYISIMMLLATYFEKDFSKIISFNSRILLGLIFFFATIQKLTSVEFTDGSYLSLLSIDGSLFKLFKFNDNFSLLIDKNQEIINKINNTNPLLYSSEKLLIPFSNYQFVMIVFTLLTIIIEGLLSILFFTNRKNYTHYIFITFLIILFFTRTETGFIALLSILGLGTLVNNHFGIKLSYTIIFVVSLVSMYINFGYF